MDEDTAIINSNTRNEKIKNFFINNKKLLIQLAVIIFMILICFSEYKERKKIKISDQYNTIVLNIRKNKENKNN